MEFEFDVGENVLLLGEGNFSFCRDLVAHMKIKREFSKCGQFSNVYASCFEEEPNSNIREDVKEFLVDQGVQLIYGVDATKLEQHELIRSKRFSRIIFNFPHIGGKMKINLNRKLLIDFFLSSAHFIDENGSVVVSLCEGQGGTQFDKPRRYDDTWKIVECGAEGGFILESTSPWPAHLLFKYRSIGFRGKEKPFRTEGAVVHVFKKAEPLNTHYVPDNVMGLHEVLVPNCGNLHVPLAYKRFLNKDPIWWKSSVLLYVETIVLQYLPSNFNYKGDLPLTTEKLVDESQIQCLLDGRIAYLRSSFVQVLREEDLESFTPRCYSGVIFRQMDSNFSSYPGSYQMLILGPDLEERVHLLSQQLGVEPDLWCHPLRPTAWALNLETLCLELFKGKIQSAKTLWNPKVRVAFQLDGSVTVRGTCLYPATFTFDISFSSNGPMTDEPFHRLLHNLADDIVESVSLQSRYCPEGTSTVHHCHRITYRSYDKPLHRSCVVKYQHGALWDACETYLSVNVR